MIYWLLILKRLPAMVNRLLSSAPFLLMGYSYKKHNVSRQVYRYWRNTLVLKQILKRINYWLKKLLWDYIPVIMIWFAFYFGFVIYRCITYIVPCCILLLLQCQLSKAAGWCTMCSYKSISPFPSVFELQPEFIKQLRAMSNWFQTIKSNYHIPLLLPESPGPRFNIKKTSYQHRKSHCGDKTIVRPSYLHNEISYTGKMASLYWIRALFETMIGFLSFEICTVGFSFVRWSAINRLTTDIYT